MTLSPTHFIAVILINLIAFMAAGQSVPVSKVTILVEGMMKSKSGAT